MSYTALYRKFRPSEFEDVKGQDHMLQRFRTRLRRTGSDMRICFAEREEPERQRLRKYLQRQ